MPLIDSIAHNRQYPARIVRIDEVATNTYEITFGVDGISEFLFEPGQYVWVDVGSLTVPDARGSRRAYSIASAFRGVEFSILFRGSASGHKQTLLSKKVGDSVQVIGPFGYAFSLPLDVERPVVLLAGGVGVAPFLSILRREAEMPSGRRIFLYVSNLSRQSTPCLAELRKMGRSVLKGRLTLVFEAAKAEHFENLIVPHALYYVSGPQQFVNAAFAFLSARGVESSQMRFEENYPDTRESKHFEQLARELLAPLDRDRLPTSTSLFRLALETAMHHTIVTDLNGKIVFANRAAQRITGFTLGEMIGNTPRLWGGYMPENFYSWLWSASAEEPFTGEIVNRRKNGELYTALFQIMPLMQTNGSRIGFVATEMDISDRVLDEQRDRSREAFLEAVLANIPSAVLVKDGETHTYVYANHLAEELFGQKNSLVGKRDQDIFPESFAALLGRQADLALSQFKPVEISRQKVVLPDLGERVFAVKKIAFMGPDKNQVSLLCLFDDVTSSAEREMENAAHVQELERINTAMIGRELKMIELKDLVKKLEGEKVLEKHGKN